MIRTLKISAAVAIAGAFSVAQGATCPSESYGAISFKSYGSNKCVAIIDADGPNHNDPVVITEDITVDSVYYSRDNATSSSNQTIVLPFDVPSGCFFDDGAQFLEIDKISQDSQSKKWRALLKTRISVQNEGLKANYPYILRFNTHDDKKLYFKLGSTKDNVCQFTFNTSNGAGSSKFSATPLNGTWILKGTYDKIVFDENTKIGVYGFTSTKADGKYEVGQFMKAGTGASVSPMRAYLVYNSQGTMAKAAPGLSFAPAADLLPASIEVIEEGECFQEGDGIFEVKMINDKRVACIDGKSDARLQTLSIPEDVTVDSIAYNREFKLGTMSTIMLPFDVGRGCSEGAEFYEIAYIKNVRTDLPQGRWEIYLGNPQQWAEEGILANKPYIISANNASIKFNTNAWGNPCNYVLNTSTGSTKTSFTANFENSDSGLPGTWEFTGTYEKITLDENTKKGVYGFAANSQGDNIIAGQFIKAGTGASVPPMRAYLKYNAAGTLAKGAASTGIAEEDLPETIVVKFLNTDGEVTAIGQMNTTTGEISMDENKWFDMKGRMMNKKPTVKGTYYNKGQKVIIK